MAFIEYRDPDSIPERYRVDDTDHIIQVHGVSPEVMRKHYELYIALMRKRSPLTRIQRETIAVAVSSHNHCHY